MYRNTLHHFDLLPEIERKLLQDLVREFPENVEENPQKLQLFPTLPEENNEEVVIRNTGRAAVERPKTIGSSISKPQEPTSLKLSGVNYIEICGEDKCIKLELEESLQITNSVLQILTKNGTISNHIKYNFNVSAQPKLVGKKEIDVIATNATYRLIFHTSKDAKIALNQLQTQFAIPAKNPKPFWPLMRLLKKRSSRDLLESKGILQNEPIFGNTLEQLHRKSGNTVPEVVEKLTKFIELPENISSVGLYRASANLATVQNIRFEINSGRWEILDRFRDDVDVLAGTLKLFFRELQEAVIPTAVYQLLRGVDDISEIGDILNRLPVCNRDTLDFIMKHILKVCQHKEQNKMDVYNMAICWGPSLMIMDGASCDLIFQTTEFTKITENLINFYAKGSVKPYDYVYEVVQKLTEMVDAKIRIEGIYRKAGSNVRIDRIMRLLDNGKLDEINGDSFGIHEICCALKKFLTTFRKDIVPDEFFETFLQICDKLERDALKEEVNQMVSELAKNDTLILLFQHLNRVLKNESHNKMSKQSLLQIWITTLTSGGNIQNYKIKMPKYENLFTILLELHNVPDVVEDSKKRIFSQYDNVPDDI